MSEPMAPPPPPPFPPAPAPQKNNTMKWVLGCGLGCLVVVIVAVIAVSALGYYAVRKGVPTAINTVYGQMKTEGKVPADDQATYDRIVELGTGSNASMYASTLVFSLLGTLADGAVSDDERTALNDAIALLEANPDISAAQIAEFQQKHPGIVNSNPGMMGMPAPTPSPAPEPPAVPEEATPPAAEPPAAETAPAPETAPVTPPAEGAAPTQ